MSSRRYLTNDDFFWTAAIIYGAILLVFAWVLISHGSAWEKYDTDRFYQMADTIIHGGTPYVDFQDPKPPLIFFTLVPFAFLGIKLTGGALLVAACNLASALIIFKAGWNLYGRISGLLAGLLFVVNLPWIEGFYILTEPFTLLFILASMYVLLFWVIYPKYLVAGVCAGIAIGFKQYALLAIPLSLILLFLKDELKGFIGLLAGAAIVLAAIFGFVFLVYGQHAAGAALYWSFGVAGEYVTSDVVGDGVTAWKPSGPVDYAANLVYVTVAIIPLLVFALACFAKGRRSAAERFFFASGVAYIATLIIRPYFHYIVLALPFAALLCAAVFHDDPDYDDEATVDFDVPEEAYLPSDGFKLFGDK